MTFDLSNSTPRPDVAGHPLGQLDREDLDLVLELVLKSGSLKDLAASYGVSYPTIRARVDKLIARLEAITKGLKRDPLVELLANLVDRGEITPSAARTVRDVARQQREGGVS